MAFGAFMVQRRFIGEGGYTTVSGKGDSGLPLPLPPHVRKFAIGIATPWLILTLIVYAFAFFGSLVEIWGRDNSLTLRHYVKAFGLDWGVGGLVWSGAAWNSFWTTIKLSLDRGAADRGGRLADRLSAGAREVQGAGQLRVPDAARLCDTRAR
jgi:iron(III) transport system permease protein